MAICHQRKLIFVHIPKNAGTSIHSLFDTNPRDYLPDQRWTKYKNHFSEYWEDYTTFSIVRNPISRFISFYKYWKMNENLDWDINYFIKNIDKIKTPIKNQQSWFICENGKIMVDVIVRYENLYEELKKIKIDHIPHLNISKIKDESFLNLSKTSLDILQDLYREDFKLL
jgi:hypothetical protein